tara:strand:+ start:1848 stop:3260 length:1413 start_codon:yes stop_codon:yes gene_type:complete
MNQQNPFVDFIKTYKKEPTLFCENVLGISPDKWQSELMEAIVSGERKVSVRSAHGVGKSSVASWILIHTLLTHLDCKLIVTAPTSGQLFDALFAELKKWIGEMPQALQDLVDVKSDRIVLKSRSAEAFISARTSRKEQPEALAGVHSQGKVILLCDEASGIPEEVFESAAGSMSGHNVHTILLGNPTRNSGLFYDTHHKLKGAWKTFHISAFDSDRVSDEFVEEMAMRYGEESSAYKVRVLGEFAEETDDTIIPLELVDSAIQREIPNDHGVSDIIWALDVARHGADSSVLVKKQGNIITDIKTWKRLDLMELSGRVQAEFDTTEPENRPMEVYIDVIGMGYGVLDSLNAIGRLNAVGINVAESPSQKETYMNLRSELWFKFRSFLEGKMCKLPANEYMIADLISVKYKFTAGGKIQVESKDQIKKRIGRSPDVADALVLLMAGDAIASRSGSYARDWKQPLVRDIKGVV